MLMMENFQLNGITPGIMLLILPLVSCGIICSSPYYCVTKEFKYVSMDRVPKVYLNTTAITTHVVNKTSECQKFCMKEDNCTSINLKLNESKGHDCYLLAGNKFSNSSLLVKDEAFTHLYIPSKCGKNPCKNGGICVPLCHNDSYVCECKSTGSWISRGDHCETVLSGYMSGFFYYSFNDKQKATPYNRDNIDMSSYSIKWPGGYVPDSKSPVVLCEDGKAFCVQIFNSLPCLNSFTNCNSAVTYSIWLRFQKSQVGRNANIITRSSYSQTGLMLKYFAGRGYKVVASISTSKRWDIESFGTTVDNSKWNQFTLVFDDTKMACAYINGVKAKCQTVSVSVSLTASTNNAHRIGGSWYPRASPAIYFDDFGIWQVALTASEVMSLYNDSKW